jgi:hypothetical protein
MTTIRGALETLYIAANKHMTPAELSEVANTLLDSAESFASNCSTVAEGIACLVSHDGMSDDRAGTFQTADDVFPLMWAMSQQFDTIAGMVHVANLALSQAKFPPTAG